MKPRMHWFHLTSGGSDNGCSVMSLVTTAPDPPAGGSTKSLKLIIDENGPTSGNPADNHLYFEMPDEIGHGDFEVSSFMRFSPSEETQRDGADGLELRVIQRDYTKLDEPNGTQDYTLCSVLMVRETNGQYRWKYKSLNNEGITINSWNGSAGPPLEWNTTAWWFVRITGNVQTKIYHVKIYEGSARKQTDIDNDTNGLSDLAFVNKNETSPYDRNYVRIFGFCYSGYRSSYAAFNASNVTADVDSVGVKSQAIMTLTDEFNLSYSTPLIDTADSEEKGVRLGAGTDYLKTFSETRFGSVESIIKRISGSTIYFESDHGSIVSLMLRKNDAKYFQFSVDGGNNWVIFDTPLPIYLASSGDIDHCVILETASQIPHIKTTTTTPLHLEPRGDLLLNPDGKISANSKKIEEVANPTNPQDAATKNYVDNIVTLDSAFDNGKEIDGATSLANAMKVGNGTKRFNFHTQTVLGAVHPTLYFTDEFVVIQNDHNTLLTLLFYKDDSTYAQFGLMKNTGAFVLDCTGQLNFFVSNDSVYYAYLLTASQIPHLKSTGHLHLEPAGNLELNPTGGSTVVTGNFDLKTNSAPFLPRRVSQSAQPTPASGELLIWRDSDDNKVYLVYNDPDAGVKKVELA